MKVNKKDLGLNQLQGQIIESLTTLFQFPCRSLGQRPE